MFRPFVCIARQLTSLNSKPWFMLNQKTQINSDHDGRWERKIHNENTQHLALKVLHLHYFSSSGTSPVRYIRNIILVQQVRILRAAHLRTSSKFIGEVKYRRQHLRSQLVLLVTLLQQVHSLHLNHFCLQSGPQNMLYLLEEIYAMSDTVYF